jgi:ferredoxin
MEYSTPGFTVDRELCMGSGSCAFHAPRTFDLDDGLKVLVLANGDTDAAVAAAIDSCPSGALRRKETG